MYNQAFYLISVNPLKTNSFCIDNQVFFLTYPRPPLKYIVYNQIFTSNSPKYQVYNQVFYLKPPSNIKCIIKYCISTPPISPHRIHFIPPSYTSLIPGYKSLHILHLILNPPIIHIIRYSPQTPPNTKCIIKYSTSIPPSNIKCIIKYCISTPPISPHRIHFIPPSYTSLIPGYKSLHILHLIINPLIIHTQPTSH